MKRAVHIVAMIVLGLSLFGANPTAIPARQTPKPGLAALVARTHGEVLRLDEASLALRCQAVAATMASCQPQTTGYRDNN